MPEILYNLDQIDAALRRFPQRPDRVTTRPPIYHSFKANTFVPLLEWCAARGMGASVANAHELALAQQLGMTAICATSPAFDDALIARMRGDGVEVFLATLQQVSAVPPGSRIALRLRVTKAGSPHPSRFGFAANDPALHDVLRARRLTVTALLLHHRNIETPGDLDAHVTAAGAALQVFRDVDWVNLGGGMTALAQDDAAWTQTWDRLCERRDIAALLRMASFEPGAQHLSGAGYLVSRVLDRSMSDSARQRLVIDASHWVLDGWSYIRPMLPSGTVPTDLFGPTCYEDDLWARGTHMGQMAAGDMLGFANMGSYITSMARRFCMMDLPGERLVSLGPAPDLDALRRASRRPSADLEQQDDQKDQRHEMQQDKADQHLRV